MRQIDVSYVGPVDEDRAGIDPVQRLDQAGDRGLSAAARADDADEAALLHREVDILQGRVAHARIGELDILELDLAFDPRVQRPAVAVRLGGTVHHLAQHAHRQRGLLILVNEADKLDQRPGDPAGKHLESDQRTDGQFLGEDEMDADRDDRHGQELLEQARDRPGRDADHPDIVGPVHGGGRHLVPVDALARLERQRLDGLDAVDAFDQHGLASALGVVERLEPAAVRYDHQANGDRHQQREAEHDRCQHHAVGDQHRQEDEEHRQVEKRHHRLTGQELADVRGLLHVLGQHTGADAREELRRQ